MKKVVNLKSLSEMLGLSQTTVSRALNGFPEVNEKTRRRVVETAKRVNYQPSSTASKLARGKTHTIGHVVPLSEHMMINPHFTEFIAGAGEAYAKHDYDLLIRVVPEEDEEKMYRELVQQKRVDGVVVHGPKLDDPRIALLKEIGLPFVVHGRSDHEKNDFSWLDVNNRNGMLRATEFLISLGHQRIGLINGLEDMNFAARRRMGFEAAMQNHNLAIHSNYLYAGDMLEPYGYNAMRDMLAMPQPPSAILVSSILPAMGAHRAIVDAGKRLAEDVSIIAFDDCLSFLNFNAASGIPLFTCLRSSIREAGNRVATMLIEQIEQGQQNNQHELWEAELVLGASTGKYQGELVG